MLKDRVDGVARQHPGHRAVARAEELLDTAYERVSAHKTGDGYVWRDERDRSLADQVRIEILETLVELGELQ